MTSIKDLRVSYESATYVALDRGKEVAVRANAPHPALDKLLEAKGAAEAVFMTAYNPENARKGEAENQAANKRLREILEEEDLDFLPAEHRAPKESDWPVEKSFLILDLPPADALALAEMFGQYAILWAAYDQPAQLLFSKLAKG
ncbi:DUF3293 domain-containing protein [Indioceanicola profundi]|uniref:DUF3293 domain-containing protein n=1 Tax=Indioceanicola profundi TaxID=2220096 RepID=UPI000E6AB84D|nr:DUF3293 domain-containing protein [Indioceanicola profundi]